ncbi:GlxA family transcriptional regulator [Neorhizobium alkalisoli]|uniref:AraC family transcriptional regulator with amidase-like domain n=1 Tax=Neorhizobium alkalisoli TaxID=528178 RepID=A0A561QSN9_9HYPH|nr:helix-turn-helix domain-containing protein [Neorhizobium alkalisoli]TWF53398.1 AraC family transcriptional regulator with amidase-like domain [Neorhizobium alkalisoli]
MRIAILAYDGISPFMLSTPLAVFGEPFVSNGHDVLICGQNGRVSATGGLFIETPHELKKAGEADIVILPGWRHADEPVAPEILAEIKAAGARGATVVGLCLGAFGLAEAGLLTGRRATTHWARIETFATRYPDIEVDPHAIFVDEGDILTSAGIASGLDCCLHLLARLSGKGEANRVARHLVLAPQRQGEQPQLVERPAPGSSAELRVAELLDGLVGDPTGVPSLDELADRAGMSRRSLTRHIRARTGDNLGGWLRRARVSRAQEMLLAGGGGLDQVAERCGFPDAKSLRTAFRAELGLTPMQWQARQRLG